jgi:hypothetical protein
MAARVPEKLITYWRVRSGADATATPEWEELDGRPTTRAGLTGELKVENDDQIMLIFFVDQAAQERVTQAARDAAALAREHEIPHVPVDRPEP